MPRLVYSHADDVGPTGTTEALHAQEVVDWPVISTATALVTVSCYVQAGVWLGSSDEISLKVRSGGTNDTVDGTVEHTESIGQSDLEEKRSGGIYEGAVRFQFTMTTPSSPDFLKICGLGVDSADNPGQVATVTTEAIVLAVEEP